MKKRSISLVLCFVLVLSLLLVPHSFAEATTEGAVLVAEGSTEEVLSAWATGNYSYIQLQSDDVWTMNGENVVIDLAGFNLTVSGTGNISAFDTANDTYDKSACGVILNNGSVTFTEAMIAPNGNRYITVLDSNKATAHRLDMKIGTVSLRTSSAGIYYKAQYDCDSVLAEKVQSYGMIVSLNNVPGADFKNDGSDINKYTVAAEPFESGRITTSGSVFGIMKQTRPADKNDENARMPIYANAYVDFGSGPIVADVNNVGKTVSAEGFTGVGLSLYDVLQKIDSAYDSYSTATRTQLDNFHLQWKDRGMDWSFENVGKTADTMAAVDNSNLVFDEGTTNAVCPVCQEKVTWTALTVEETHQNLNGHYYVPEDLTFANSGDAFFFNSTKNSTLCVHLNGHNLTATKTRVLHGSSGRVNVMGNGIVTGHQGSAGYAAAVQVNNTIANQSVHLYGGTYQKTANSHANAATVGISTAGGHLSIYEGATIENSGNTAIIVKANTYKLDVSLGLYGCTVNGNVILPDVTENATNDVAVEIVDGSINGNMDVFENNQVCLSGAPVISSVTLNENVLNTQALTKGASIGIATDGIFTAESASVKNYVDYFYGAQGASKITVRDNALHCGPDYTANLVFAEGTTDAMCPACKKVVTWTPVDGSKILDNSTAKLTQHYYLTNDVTFTAENGELSFLSPGHGTHTVCFHLNGHNFTGTNTRLVYGGTSTTNVMGTGVVTGSRADVNGYGSTVQINVANITGTVNLYSGTWKQAEGGKYPNDYVISISGNGGTVNVYEDAVIEANSNGKAIYIGSSNYRHSISTISGTVKGDVYVEAAKQPDTYIGKITVDGGTITGTLDVNGVNNVTVAHDAKIGKLDMEETSKLTLDAMTKGASITVLNKGVFTEPHTSAAAWADYFHPANSNDVIKVVENALCYKVDYTAKLYPDAEGKAYCPACEATVVWTPLTDNTAAQNLNGHYYLLDDIVYEKTGDGYVYNGTKNTSLCLHLNGNDITATNTYAILGSSGYLNVLGRGVVSGYDKDVADGMTIRLNNTVANNGISLYGGTYRGYNPASEKALISLFTNGGTVKIYEDAVVDAGEGGNAIYCAPAGLRNKELGIYGATVIGDIKLSGVAEGSSKTSSLELADASITGEVSVAGENAVTISGGTQIRKLTLAAGVLVDFKDVKDNMDIAVSATGCFTYPMEQADRWLKYITCADEGVWIVVRDKTFYQEPKPEIPVASETDQAALLETYKGKTLRYGEMHNHTNSGPYRDDGTGYTPSTGADGTYSLEEWITEMDRLKLDFAFIVDHGMSIHMYKEKFLPEYFIGGTEPGTNITDSKASPKSPHYNMLFADPEKLESIFFKWEDKFKPFKWNKENYPNALNPSEEGYRVVYPSFTTAQFTQLAKDVYDAGGLLVQVHPKHEGYLTSDDPLDYYFGDYTGFEIITGNGKAQNMMHTYNNKAYETWVDLLELGKKVWATAGSDSHKLPDISALTAMYTTNDHKDDYMAAVRAGNMAPGWVGIRMNVNGTAMGGETDFTGNRLQFSVGDIYNTGVQDKATVPTPAPYVEGHTYCAQLYDDGGLLMESIIDPTQMNYFAIDCDATAKFYRVVVWDLTAGTRIGVSNPIWNTASAE